MGAQWRHNCCAGDGKPEKCILHYLGLGQVFLGTYGSLNEMFAVLLLWTVWWGLHWFIFMLCLTPERPLISSERLHFCYLTYISCHLHRKSSISVRCQKATTNRVLEWIPRDLYARPEQQIIAAKLLLKQKSSCVLLQVFIAWLFHVSYSCLPFLFSVFSKL